MKNKFIIIDGSSLVHRAFYALPPLVNKAGVNTGAVYGFLNMLIRLLQDEAPEFIAVAFDKSRKTFRNEMYSEYKAQRKETPSELSEQFPLVSDLIRSFGITVLELEGFEADDIIGTLARQAEEQGVNSVIVTGDKDALQLIDKNTKVLLTKKGISEVKMMDIAALQEEYALQPVQITDLKGLMGDSSDNIPGVPGVGEKTALKLLAEYQTVENLLENADKIKGKLGEKIQQNQEIAILSKKLATIDRNVPVEFSPDQFVLNPDRARVDAMLAQLEFRNFANKIDVLFGESKKTEPQESKQVEVVQSKEQAQSILFAKQEASYLCYYTDGNLPEIKLEGLEVFTGEQVAFFKPADESWPVVKKWLCDEAFHKIGCDVKSLYQACEHEGIDIRGLTDDCAVAAYLCDPSINNYTLQELAAHFSLRDNTLCASQLLQKLFALLQQQLSDMQLEELYNSIEFPLTKVLAGMEIKGIKVDEKQLDEMSKELHGKTDILQNQIYKLAGEEFNINSPKQLGSILFEKLALPVQKKTKTGYSTDAEVLDNLSGLHPIVDEIIEYRMLSKLQSTYLEGLKPLINKQTKRVYTHFQQFVTTTGRLSSTDPNLQNIPIRTETGKRIREFFVPGEAFDWLVSFDYSQVELRILAHISGDPLFTEAFLKDQDIHTRTASEVFGVDIDEVTPQLRSRAKAVNFGIVYGISDYGLARNLGISRTEAATYIKNYFARYQGIKAFMEKAIEDARRNGYVTTMFNRRRYLPEINSSNFNRRSFAERTAINTPIQGTAADIIKKAMVDVAEVLSKEKLKSNLLLQVHDELVFEAPEGELEQLAKVVKDKMQNAASLDVPLVVDAAAGKNWSATKDQGGALNA